MYQWNHNSVIQTFIEDNSKLTFLRVGSSTEAEVKIGAVTVTMQQEGMFLTFSVLHGCIVSQHFVPSIGQMVQEDS